MDWKDKFTYGGTAAYFIRKQLIDRTFSVAVLVLLSPLILLLALLIVLDDPHAGPFYVQTRVGKSGVPFRLYKLRTMKAGAEAELDELLPHNEVHGAAFKMKNDPRVTRVGRLLRETGLDELPQFLNVLKGNMSIVGPRPPVPREAAQYSAKERRRLAVRPGITGYWQIMPHRNDLPFSEWVELDLKYIRERSTRVDLKIMAATVGAMMRRQGE